MTQKCLFVGFFLVLLVIVFGFQKTSYGEENEYRSIVVEINGKNCEIYYKIAPRENMSESPEYCIKDEATMDLPFYISGFRKYNGTEGSTRWNVEKHNIPEHKIEGSFLLDILFENDEDDAEETYKDIFRTIYEKIGFSKDRN